MSMRLPILIGVFAMLSLTADRGKSTTKPWAYITEGVGISGILIDKSTVNDVVSGFGKKYTVITHNKYSRELEYSDLDLSFYYCFKDKEKKIFLIEVHHGTTSKGIVIGRSTLKDVIELYGKEDDRNCNGGSCVYEYKGVQFYVEGPYNIEIQHEVNPSEMRVVEIDVMSPTKSSNFCDGFEHALGADSP